VKRNTLKKILSKFFIRIVFVNIKTNFEIKKSFVKKLIYRRKTTIIYGKNKQMVDDFKMVIENDVYLKILEYYDITILDKETISKILNDLVDQGFYGWDDNGWSRYLYFMVSSIFSNPIKNEFKFVELDKKWDDEDRGGVVYNYYEYEDPENEKLLENSVYRVLWDVFKYGNNIKGNDYLNRLEDINEKLRETSKKLIEHIRENSDGE
jgi:hypothetical protein